MGSSAPLSRRYVALLARSPLAVVGLWVTLAGVAFFGARQLRVDTNLEALLPSGTASLVALDELRERVQVHAPLYVLIESSDEAMNQAIAAEVQEAIAQWPETRWAIDRRDPAYFVDRRLLYLPAEEVERLSDAVEERVRWESCAVVPGCVNFLDRPELPTEASLREAFAAQPGHAELLELVGGDGVEAVGESAEGRLCSDDGHVCIVQASLDGDPGNLAYAESILARTEAVVANARPANAPADLTIEIGGRYQDTPLTKRLTERDLSNTGVLSTVLVLLLVLLQFRGVRSLIGLTLPLAAAILATLGALGYAGVSLNLISAFTLAVLAGIGIDFGLHLLTHYGELREAEQSPEQALGESLQSLGRSLLVAGTTTAAAFLALAAARFQGFSQMGWVASLGVVLSLVAYLTLFPALMLAMHRLLPERRALFRKSPLETMARPSRTTARRVALVGAALVVAALPVADGLDFEYRFDRLRPPGVSNTILRAGAERGPQGTPVYALADSAEALEGLDAVLASTLGDGDARPVILSPRTLLPADQAVKLDAIRRMREAVARIDARLGADTRVRLEPLRPALAIREPITAESLPRWARDYVATADGSGGLGVIYVPFRGSNARQMERLTAELEAWRQAHPGVVFASPEALLGEVVPALRDDAPRIVGLALLGLLIAVAVIGRSLRRSALVLAPVVAAVVLGVALAVLLGMKLNLYNTLVLPVAFGVGVDGAIYVVWALSGTEPLAVRWKRFTTSARAIVGSSATTLAAFGSILVAQNPGLASIGTLAVITIGFTLLANVVWLPMLILWRSAPEADGAK